MGEGPGASSGGESWHQFCVGLWCIAKGGEARPAYGAARLAATGEAPDSVCTPPKVVRGVEPNPRLQSSYEEMLQLYREIYNRMRPLFAEQGPRIGDSR